MDKVSIALKTALQSFSNGSSDIDSWILILREMYGVEAKDENGDYKSLVQIFDECYKNMESGKANERAIMELLESELQ